MTLTHEQLKERDRGIGSSDAAMVLGLSKWGDASTVYARKLGLVPPIDETPAMRSGNALEPFILEEAAAMLGKPVVTGGDTFVKGCLRANVDGMLGRWGRGETIVEAKRAFNDPNREWGEDGTDAVPLQYRVQVMHQMICAESYLAHIARFDGYRITLHPIEFDRDLAERIQSECANLWYNHIERKIPPPPDYTALSREAIVNALHGLPDEEAELPAELVTEYAEACEELRRAESRKSKAYGELLRLAQESGARKLVSGTARATFSTSVRRSLDQKRLKEQYPEAWDACQKVSAPIARLSIRIGDADEGG